MRKFIFDDTGTGKTKRSIDMMVADDCKSIIVVCPASVVNTAWVPQVKRWCPGADVRVVDGETMKRRGDTMADAFKHPGGRCFFVVSYNSMYLLGPMLKKVPDELRWGVIFDESHYTKSPRSLRHKNAVAVSKKALSVLMLTATPTPRSLEDLYCQCAVLYPAKDDRCEVYGPGFSSLGAFREEYGTEHSRWVNGFNKREWTYSERNASEVSRLLESTVAPIIHAEMGQPRPYVCPVSAPSAREVETFNKWIQDETYQDKDVQIDARTASELANKKAQLDDGFIYDTSGVPHWFGSSKLDSVVEKAHSIRREYGGGPVLVWTRFKASFEWFFEHEKHVMGARDFLESPDDDVDIIVGSQQSMGTGVDGLQHYASHQIWVDLPYTAASFIQANARLIRKGQPDPSPMIFIAETELNRNVFDVVKGRAKLDEIVRHKQQK